MLKKYEVPLHSAARNNSVEMSKLLIENGADPNIQNNDICELIMKFEYNS